MQHHATSPLPTLCAGALLALLAAACGAAVPPQRALDATAPDAAAPDAADLLDASRSRTRLYVSFAGATVTRAARDDASAAESALCAATVPAFAHERFGDSRAQVVAEILAAIRELFAGYEIEITAERPTQGPYHMLLLGGAPSLCGMPEGLAGLAPLDCGNSSAADIAFVFTEPLTAVEIVALAAAHEAGHAFGLPHTMAPCDVMSNFLCADGPKRFLDEQMDVTPDQRGRCGLQVANSHALLVAALRAEDGPAARP